MKYLVLGSMKDAAATLPPTVIRQLIEATIPHMERHAKAGKFTEFYFIPGWNRLMNITEAESAEELFENFSQNAMIGLWDIEVYPLADGAESMKTMLEAVKVAEKAVSASTK